MLGIGTFFTRFSVVTVITKEYAYVFVSERVGAYLLIECNQLGKCWQELLLYKYVKDGTWNFVDGKSVPNPVHKLFYEDLTGDGVSELITVTAKGLHIYQVRK